MNERFKTVNQLAEMTGKDRRAIKKKLSDLAVHSRAGRSEYYDMFEVLPRLYSASKDAEITKQLQEEQLRYEQARADRMVLDVEERRGEVVAVSEVAKVVSAEYANVRARILSIPSRCAKDLSLESDPSIIKVRLDQEVSEALAELTADKTYQENEDNVDQLETPFEGDAEEVLEGPADSESGGMG